MIYPYKSCHWGEQHLRNYKSNNGHRLHIKSLTCISSMMKSLEFLTPHTGLTIFNYVCVLVFFPAMSIKLEMTMPKKNRIVT